MYFVIDPETLDRVRAVVAKQPDKPQNLRVFIAGMGWGGPSFGLGLDHKKEDDLVEEIGGITFLMEKYIEASFGQVEIKWNGYSYVVGPLKHKPSNC